MIFVDKSIVDIPKVLLEKGVNEKKKAVDFFSNPKNIDKSFKSFKVYADKSVKLTLNELFNGKCAYCESKFIHVYVGDVEHFRPKGKVSSREVQRPGYYWLASDWDNLLISCRNCNQASREFVGTKNERVSIGKVDKFPLMENVITNTALSHIRFNIEEEEQQRLLINPCKENPEDFFDYDYKTGIIKPKNHNASDKKKELMANKSIQVYGLQRVSLVHQRQKKAIEILAQIQRVKDAIVNLNAIDDNKDTGLYIIADSILERELKYLMDFKSKDAEYVGLANFIIDKFYDEIFEN